MEPVVRVVAALVVLAGMAGFVWAMVRHTATGVWPRKLMIAAPLSGMIGFALLLGIS
jgi:hypothetical protein